MTEFSEQLNSLAQKARTWRLAGEYHHGRDAEFPLVGYCFDNAYVCWHLLDANGITAHLIEGTTERVADEFLAAGEDPREFEAVEDLAGLVHYWLHVEGPAGETYYVDIASDSFETLGECLVSPTLPEDYIELPDSKQEGRETLQMVRDRGDRCSCCGDQRYTDGGCPACHDTELPE